MDNFSEEDKKRIISEMIFDGYGKHTVERFGKKWTLKTLSSKEKLECWNMAMGEANTETQWQAFMLYTLQISLIAINDVYLTQEISEEICGKLPTAVLIPLYEEYKKIDDLQQNFINNTKYIHDIAKEDFASIKFKVMKAFNALPTEDRVKQMNDHQWFWCYYGLVENRKEEDEAIKIRMDYLSYFINPELAERMRKQKDSQQSSSNNVMVQHEHDEVDPNNPNVTIHYGEGIIDEDFDMKLKMAMGDGALTELPSDKVKGNEFESSEDFIQKALFFEKQEKEHMQQLQEQRKQDAELAGKSEDAYDIIDVK